MELDEPPQDPFEPIAIVGISALFPDAPDADTFWRNILSSRVSIGPVPDDRWTLGDFWEEGGPGNISEGKTYSKIGAFVSGIDFDWRRWKQPPGTLPQIDPCQLWAVTVSASALEDAGYLGENSKTKLPNSRTGVIFANALGGENRNLSNQRVWADNVVRKAKESGLPIERIEEFKEALVEGLPRIDEDTMPGELANVVAGRVANLLDLQGPNYSTDAACASTFAALLDACRLLQTRQVDVMLAGASDRTMDPSTYAKFSSIGALSSTHSTPFDAKANGFVMGEGAGCMVLKRLSSAISEGDNVYAVIRGIGASSDGRGKGITAPSKRGQNQAILRAYQQACYEPESVQLIEAHGTSTKVGDATELNTLSAVFDGIPPGENVAVGSIKSQIGHLKAAAGMAGMLKATLALFHKTIPPSAGFEEPNTSVEWDTIPFYVPTKPSEWGLPDEGLPRRAGISSFGFGGTNFHCTIEEYEPQYHLNLAKEWNARRVAAFSLEAPTKYEASGAASIIDSRAKPSLSWDELKKVEGGMLLLNSSNLDELSEKITTVRKKLFDNTTPNFDDDPKGRRLSIELEKVSKEYLAEGYRCAIVASSWSQLEKKFDLIQKSLADKSKWEFLSKQLIFVTEQQPLTPKAKTVQMYPGQGSQYVGMTCDLSKRYNIIGETWKEADKTMVDILQGEKLSTFVLRDNLDDSDKKIAEEKLKQTEYTQPSMLTADLAIHRLLEQHGIVPDMVAGHSLGEYAALNVSGILKFHDALRAAAARGTEMGNVDVPDTGLMASISAPFDTIETILSSAEGYVVSANKNSPQMTVIAGETKAVKDVLSIFSEKGISSTILQTSHAFHSKIVAPANEPLRRFLEGLELSLPDIPITANFNGEFYPSKLLENESVHDAVLKQLAPQMSSPVEWTKQMNAMYEAGGRIFIEVGPKRALSMFAEQIFSEKLKLITNTNHPKVGGISSFYSSLAILALAGRMPKLPDATSSILTEGFRAGPIEAWESSDSELSQEMTTVTTPALPIVAEPKPTPTTPVIKQSIVSSSIEDYVASRISEFSGYPSTLIKGNLDLVNGLGMDINSIELALKRISSEASVSSALDVEKLTKLPEIVKWINKVPSKFSTQETSQANMRPVIEQNEIISYQRPSTVLDINVVSGIGMGLPGLDEVFAPNAMDLMLEGTNFISELSVEFKQQLLDKNIVRIVKHSDGNAEFVVCNSFDTIPQLAGRAGYFDLSEQYGIDKKIVDAFDITTKLAFAAGLEALKDSGLPLLPVEQVSSNGKRLIKAWHLPEKLRDRTGVISASVFPGIQMAMKHALNNGADSKGNFDRKFLLQVLTMVHSQFAQWIGARGPNTAINNACASTPAAFAIAEDWLTTGRCDKVIIISGDDVTCDELLPWFGAGFTAAGAHSMGSVVEEVALPFDARRSGMLMGMGGAAFVLEKSNDVQERGVVPYVELLGTHIGNSAFHPTRLDVDHVSSSLDEFIGRMEKEWNFDRHEIASSISFMSHEPATPPRGGSAAAEIFALRHTFGKSANKILITNTKGFTGHPMGVGIEDATLIYGMAVGKMPPIANFKEPDADLGDLLLSKGGSFDIQYGLRHAAGFGSQTAFTLVRKVANGIGRVDRNMQLKWIKQVSQSNAVDLRIDKRKLVAYLDVDENLIGGITGDAYETVEYNGEEIKLDEKSSETHTATKLDVQKPEATQTEKVPQKVVIDAPKEINSKVLETVAKHTGYPEEFLELDQDLEGELGIDTVKQAEIMTELRQEFEMPIDENFVLSEHPTLNHMISYIAKMTNQEITTNVVEDIVSEDVDEPEPEQMNKLSKVEDAPTVSENQNLVTGVLEVVVEHTGYPMDFLELDQDLEGELGIDTVKQAEVMVDLRSKFNLPVDENFVLSEHPTLNHIIQYIEKLDGKEPDLTPIAEPEIEVIDVPEIIEKPQEVVSDSKSSLVTPRKGIRRWQVEVEEIEIEKKNLLNLVGKVVLITEEHWDVTAPLCLKFKEMGIIPVKLFLDNSSKTFEIQQVDGITRLRCNPGKAKHISQAIDEATKQGKIAGVIHLTPLELVGLPWSADSSEAQMKLVCHSLFGILNALEKLDIKLELVSAISALDGRHGNVSDRFNSIALGASGIVKSYSKERPECRCKALDLHPEWLTEPMNLIPRLIDELLSYSEVIEVGLDRDTRRWKLVLFDEELVSESRELPSSDIILVSGGGSGVTAEAVVGLCESSINSHARFILLGRTELTPETKTWISWDDAKLETRKMKLREEMESTGEKVTMVSWNNAWSKLLRSRDVYNTISRIEKTGNFVDYYSCDVTNVKSMGKLGKTIGKEIGEITGIIHGAGIEESKLIKDKTWKSFDSVVRVKVIGWSALMLAAKSSGTSNLRLGVCFTSIAGRFGNAGQVDYAAANNILDAEMARISAESNDTFGLAIGWTGWKDVGMATKGSIEKVFSEAGIETLSVKKGVELFVQEVTKGGKRRVIASGELGILDTQNVKRAAPLRLPSDVTVRLDDTSRFPFVDRFLQFKENESLVSECTLETSTHTFLTDHAIDGVPYFPGVMALEMFAENAMLLCPKSQLNGFEDASFGLPVKMVRSEQLVRVRAIMLEDESGYHRVKCILESDLRNSKGEIFGEPRIHHSAIVLLSDEVTSDSLSIDMGSISLEDEPEIYPSFIYLRFFHGPRFQAHGGLIGGITLENGDLGADGIALMRNKLPNTHLFSDDEQGLLRELESMPMVIEAAFQNAGLVSMELEGLQCLPVGIEHVRILRSLRGREKLIVRTVQRSNEDGVTSHDVLVTGEHGPLLMMQTLNLKSMAPLSENLKFSLER